VENDVVSPLSKVVMMATAFEIFLQFPKEDKKVEHFINYVEEKIASNNFKKGYRRKEENGTTRDLTLAARWARDFYNLRSHIVHGDHVGQEKLRYCAPDRAWLTHLIVADLVYLECIKREMYRQECIGGNVRALANEFDATFPDGPEGSSKEPLARCFWGFKEVHQALGWLKNTRPDKSD
jgi:hypothetical protein